MGGVGVCWSWSLFFCDALPSDHLHQVDIRRVYSGVCNCILSPVLHCQPWKWNLINPDQFLMYKMNWQGFKKWGATIQIRWMIHSNFFFQWMIELDPPPIPRFQLSYYTRFIFLSKQGWAWEGATQGKNDMYVWASVCVFMHACTYVDIHTSGDSVCVHVSLRVLAGGVRTPRKCVSKTAHGVNLPHIHGSHWGD